MVSIDKIEAFSMVVKAMEKDDMETASEVMKIISRSIEKEKKSNKFSNKIDIKIRKKRY